MGDVPYKSAASEAKKNPTAARGVKIGRLCTLFSPIGCEARWVTSDPITMRAPPAICSSVQGSRRTTTASTSVTTAFNCMTGAVKFAPAAWLAQKLQYRPTTKWSTPATESAAIAGTVIR